MSPLPKMPDFAPVPIVLIDSPDDGCCESAGWVEVTVGGSPEAARKLIAQFFPDEDGNLGEVPEGDPVVVRLLPPADEHETWHDAGDHPDGKAFWRFDA